METLLQAIQADNVEVGRPFYTIVEVTVRDGSVTRRLLLVFGSPPADVDALTDEKEVPPTDG